MKLKKSIQLFILFVPFVAILLYLYLSKPISSSFLTPLNILNSLNLSSCTINNYPVRIKGDSMRALYPSGKIVQAEFGYYDCHEIQRGETVLVKLINRPEILIKNVLILPGDQFYIRGFGSGYHMVVNNSILQNVQGKPYFFPKSVEHTLRYYENELSKNSSSHLYFVFGTTFDGSFDSSSFGPITKQEILARVPN